MDIFSKKLVVIRAINSYIFILIITIILVLQTYASEDIVAEKQEPRSTREWPGLGSPGGNGGNLRVKEAYLGDMCTSDAACVVPHSICEGSDNIWWSRQKFCICEANFHPSTGYCVADATTKQTQLPADLTDPEGEALSTTLSPDYSSFRIPTPPVGCSRCSLLDKLKTGLSSKVLTSTTTPTSTTTEGDKKAEDVLMSQNIYPISGFPRFGKEEDDLMAKISSVVQQLTVGSGMFAGFGKGNQQTEEKTSTLATVSNNCNCNCTSNDHACIAGLLPLSIGKFLPSIQGVTASPPRITMPPKMKNPNIVPFPWASFLSAPSPVPVPRPQTTTTSTTTTTPIPHTTSSHSISDGKLQEMIRITAEQVFQKYFNQILTEIRTHKGQKARPTAELPQRITVAPLFTASSSEKPETTTQSIPYFMWTPLPVLRTTTSLPIIKTTTKYAPFFHWNALGFDSNLYINEHEQTIPNLFRSHVNSDTKPLPRILINGKR